MAATRVALFRFSLRELFVVVAVVAMGIAALKYGGLLADLFVTVTMLAVMSLAICVFVDRGRTQAAAIGFVTCVSIYALAVHAVKGRDFDPHGAALPTSKMLRPVFEGVVTRRYFDKATGEEFLNYDQAKPQRRVHLSGRESPNRHVFMLVGHVMWAFLFGYLGGKFAEFVYARRVAEQKA